MLVKLLLRTITKLIFASCALVEKPSLTIKIANKHDKVVKSRHDYRKFGLRTPPILGRIGFGYRLFTLQGVRPP
jgi:hypothetical protein